MRAVREVGFKKAGLFLFISFYYLIYRVLFLPQLRKFWLSLAGAEIGNDTIIMDARFFNWHHGGFKGLKTGKQCFIGDESLIDLYNQVTLEDNVTIAQRVIIITHNNVGYKTHPLQKYFPYKSLPVIIESGSVIGAGAIIMPGITIGRNSMIGAGTVVTKNVPASSLVVGVPGKVIRRIGSSKKTPS